VSKFKCWKSRGYHWLIRSPRTIPSHELTLSKIVSLVEEPYRSALDTSRSTLLALIKSISEVNQSNTLIVKDSLHYFNRPLDFLISSQYGICRY